MELLSQGQQAIQRGLREAFVIDGAGEIRARGERSYLFDYEQPSTEFLMRAAEGETIIIEDRENNEFRALIRLSAFADRYLYVSREVDTFATCSINKVPVSEPKSLALLLPSASKP